MSIFKKAKKEPAQPLYGCRGIVVSAKEAQNPPSENYLKTYASQAEFERCYRQDVATYVVDNELPSGVYYARLNFIQLLPAGASYRIKQINFDFCIDYNDAGGFHVDYLT